LTNKKGKGRKGALVGIIEGNKAEVAIKILKKILWTQRKKVGKLILDMAAFWCSSLKNNSRTLPWSYTVFTSRN
jgi:hypothetical protein